MEQKPELLVHPIVKHAPLITRDALYGGRTEAMRLHYKIREGEESVQYCDVMSLYPCICKYFKFPIAHPIIHVADACADRGLSKNGRTNEMHHCASEGPLPPSPFISA